ncbi:MAG: efflux transporter outer membrane subunit [Kiritimatiellia bacterium]
MKTELSVGMLLMAAAGCSWLPSVGPDYEQPKAEIPELPLPDAGLPTTNLTSVGEYVPAAGEADGRTLITTNSVSSWWRSFDDPVLTDLVTESVTNNLTFLMACERLEASRWQLQGAYAAFLPKVSFGANATQMEEGPNTSSMAGTGRTLHRDLFAGGFDATWEIDIFGGSRRSTEMAWAEYEAAGWTLEDAYVSLTAEVAREYIQLRTTQQRLAVARTNLVLQTETYDIVKSRLDSGIGDQLAVSQSKYIVDQTRASIPPLLAQEEALKNALAILAGDMPGTRHASLAECPDRTWLVAPSRLETLPLDLIRGRPDVRVAERKFAAQVAAVGVAESMWYPKLYINGSLGLESLKASKLVDRDSLYGSIGPSVSWPIFQGGNVYANIKAEEARMNEAFLNYELTLEKAYGEVRDAYAAYTQEYHRYMALEGAVAAADDAVAISKDLFQTGLRDFTAVIDAQRSLLTLQEARVISRGQIAEHMIALYKALGGGRSGR